VLLQFQEEGRGGGGRRFLLFFFIFFGDSISVTVSNVSQETQLYPQFRGSGGSHLCFELFSTERTAYLRSRMHTIVWWVLI
jgi:hypothetical protein